MSTLHTACAVATREQRLKGKMGGWRTRGREETEGQEKENVRERGIWFEKYLFKARRISSVILRRSGVKTMNFTILTRTLTEFYFPIKKK